MTIAMLLEMAVDGFGDRVAVGSLTYRDLFAAAEETADRIRQDAERSLVVLDVNSPAIPVGLFGAALAGVPFVPLSYRLTAAEIAQRRAVIDASAPGDDVAVLLFTSGTT